MHHPMPVANRFPRFQSAAMSRLLTGSLVMAIAFSMLAMPMRARAEAVVEKASVQLIDEAWRAARLDQLSQAMVDNILAGVREHPDMRKLSTGKREHVLDLYRREATPERFVRRLRARIEGADAQALKAMIAVTRSPVAARALEQETAFEPVPPATMFEHAMQVRDTAEGRERLSVIERLDDAIGVTEMAVGVAAASVWGTSVAMREFEQPRSAFTGDDMERAMTDFIARVRPFQRQQIQITYLWLYRNMPLNDLREYVALQEDSILQPLQKSLVRSLGEEMIALQRDVTARVVRELRGHAERET